jgi:hypothetical protein
MPLPILTTTDDVDGIVGYLRTKAAGATVAEAKAVIGGQAADGRKLVAYEMWGIISREGDRLKLTDLGWDLARKPEARADCFRAALRGVPAYASVLEWAKHQQAETLTAVDVGQHWHQHHKDALGTDSETTINYGAVSFFHLCEAAGLGKLVVGRKGQATRLELEREKLAAFVEGPGLPPEPERQLAPEAPIGVPPVPGGLAAAANTRVFIAHGGNQNVVEQVKEIVRYGRLEPVVAEEHETPARPVPDKVLEEMRSCFAGIVHIEGETELSDGAGHVYHVINENVLIEIGAGMALYRANLILLVRKGVELASNLQGLYRCEYEGDRLDHDATMKLLRALSEFR